jgi:electron transfer flavoprotein-quinone oxidoreductase
VHLRRQRRRLRLHQPRHTGGGLVLKLPKLAAQKLRPEEIIANLKAHPGIAPLVEGGEIKEYSAHVIPEAGLSMMPKMTGDGMLVAGDAAAMCLAAGIWLEGVNFAMASGMYAAGPPPRRSARTTPPRRDSPATSAG